MVLFYRKKVVNFSIGRKYVIKVPVNIKGVKGIFLHTAFVFLIFLERNMRKNAIRPVKDANKAEKNNPGIPEIRPQKILYCMSPSPIPLCDSMETRRNRRNNITAPRM